MRVPFRLFVLAMTALLMQEASFFAAGLLRPITRLDENFSKTPNVGGFTLLGIRRGPASGGLNLQNLAADVPDHAKGRLCLTLTTRDADYSGARSYEFAGGAGGVQPLELESKYAKILNAYTADDLTGRAEMRADCTSGSEGVLVPLSFADAPRSNDIVVYVNTQKSAASVTLSDGDGKIAQTGDCKIITKGSDTAFDRLCTVTIADANWARIAKLTISIVGLTGSVHHEDYQISLGPL